jgi:hypothetical protein
MDKDGLPPRTHYRTSKSTTGRRKGGQPGNKNALRHGFYAHLYTIKEGKELKECNIEDELAALRAYVRGFSFFVPTKRKPSKEELSLFDRINNAIISINTMERTLLLARGHGGEIGQTILEALRELNPDEEL